MALGGLALDDELADELASLLVRQVGHVERDLDDPSHVGDLLPPDESVWLSVHTFDEKGITLAERTAIARNLLPLLNARPAPLPTAEQVRERCIEAYGWQLPIPAARRILAVIEGLSSVPAAER